MFIIKNKVDIYLTDIYQPYSGWAFGWTLNG